MADQIHYFAYGSNMAHQRLAERIGPCTLIGRTVLEQHKLCFHKIGQDGSAKCDAFFTGEPKHLIHGVLFSIPGHKQQVLDHYEGVGRGYERKTVELVVDDARYSAFLYYATHIDSSLLPFNWYKHHVIQGAQQAGLPSAYQARLHQVVAIEDPDIERKCRELAIHT